MVTTSVEDRPVDTALAEARSRAVASFYRHFNRNWAAFRALWSEAPIVHIPFAPPGMANTHEGQDFEAFWKPIFDDMTGRFDWTVERLITSDDGQDIVVISRSDVDVQTPLGRIAYAAEYIQVFTFEGDRIRKLTEYVDTYKMSKVYNFGDDACPAVAA